MFDKKPKIKKKKKKNLSNNDQGRRKQSTKFNFLSVKFRLDLLNLKRDKTLTTIQNQIETVEKESL